MPDYQQLLRSLSPAQRRLLALRLQQYQTGSVQPPSSGTKRLVAYIVPHTDQSIPASDLREFLSDKLPDYMIPAHFVFLDTLPLTPNGKLDRKALPEPSQTQTHTEAGYIEPRTDMEREIAGIWAALLGFDMIGIHDNFFELGGHSLLVMQVIAQLRNRYEINIPITGFFENPTIAGLAGLIETLRWVSDQNRTTAEAEDREEIQL